jgi:farnesyl diphosphate synthase
MARLGDDPVAEGMRYASDGGKRLRGFLVLETAGLFDVAPDRALYSAAAVECLHAYSLVHDDLPCMDDDDLRRGRPTVHRKWDEATAVLVGDALQTFAFELLTDPAAGDADQRVALVASLARASGAQGMVLGQAQDIAAETAGRPLTLTRSPCFRATRPAA